MKRKMRLCYLMLMAAASLLTGCVSMKGVADYADYAGKTVESVKPVAKDFYASCLRSNSYKPLANQNSCEKPELVSKGVLAIASVLGDYSAALGAMAADELVDYSKNVTALTTEIKKNTALDDGKVDAVGQLASFIAKAATSAYQQKEVARFVRSSDESVGTVATALADLVETNYVQAVALELSAWASAYREVERTEREKNPLQWEAYARLQWQQNADLKEKETVAKALAASIRKIGQTHHKLAEDASELTGKEVAAAVRSFVNEASPVIKDVQDAF